MKKAVNDDSQRRLEYMWRLAVTLGLIALLSVMWNIYFIIITFCKK